TPKRGARAPSVVCNPIHKFPSTPSRYFSTRSIMYTTGGLRQPQYGQPPQQLPQQTGYGPPQLQPQATGYVIQQQQQQQPPPVPPIPHFPSFQAQPQPGPSSQAQQQPTQSFQQPPQLPQQQQPPSQQQRPQPTGLTSSQMADSFRVSSSS